MFVTIWVVVHSSQASKIHFQDEFESEHVKRIDTLRRATILVLREGIFHLE